MRTIVATLMVVALASVQLHGQTEPPPVPSEEQPEVLTSGPVHEAFAAPVNLQDQEGLVAPEEPPARIEETPPVDRPQGEQYVWVPGYWAWDQDRHGYIWVSACWRAAPPGTYWVPGYWTKTTGGWAWVAGFWAPTANQKIQYLPVPPVYEDVEAPGLPPSEDVVWVPPCAYWSGDHFVRRAGYWVRQMEGWIWIPSHYVWTPRGYVFVAGHWDFSLSRRGVLFAPVYFPGRAHVRVGFTYSPSIVINLGVLQVSLFDCPRYSHYYFGDYYDDVYRTRGIYPRFESPRSHIWYDPLFVHDAWRNRHDDPMWVDHQRQDFDRRRADVTLRPARTYREMETRVTRAPEPQRHAIETARPLSEVARTRSDNLTFERMNRSTQKTVTTQANNVQRFRDQRNQWESTSTTKKPAPRETESKSPVTPSPAPGPRVESRRPTPEPQTGRTPPVTTQPESRRGLTAPPADVGRTEPAPAVGQRRPTATPEPSRVTPSTPRSVLATKPETVNIPKPPITAKPATGPAKREASPPTKPAEERQKARDTQRQNEDKR
jgi:hypothetical protein